jgi:ABC-type transport system substrate-binding protein
MKLRLGFFISVFFCACSVEQSNEKLSIFKYNESAGISSLDPAFSKDQANIWATAQLFNGLVQLDADLKVQPAIAKSWAISEDALIYTFRLREEILFHTHELFQTEQERVVVASDFSYSFNRLTNPKLASPGAWVMSNVASYEALNDSTFQIRLKTPFPPFLGLLSMPYCSVVPEEIVEQTDFRDVPVGTGPFQFQYWKENVKLVLRKNPDYFEKGLPKLDAVAVTFVKDKQTAFLEFIKGNLDFISGLDASYKDEVLTRDGKLQADYQDKIVLQSQPYLNTEYLGFLMDENNLTITQQKAIRQAINYGFDRVKMMTYLRNNIGTPALEGFVPKGLPSFTEELEGYSYNPERAKQLLEAANVPKGVEVVLSTTSSYLDICEYIQNQLEEVGLTIKVEVNPPSTHRQMVATSKLDFFRGSWIADYADAENYLALFYSKNFCPNGPNYTHFNNAEYDALYELAIRETNDSIRYDLYQKMDQIILDEAAIVPLYYDQVLRFVQPNISGFESNGMNMLNLKKAEKLN